MKIGYAGATKRGSVLLSQINVLSKEECQDIFQEKAGVKEDHPILDQVIRTMRPGDTLIVRRLSDLCRTHRQMTLIMLQLKEKGVQFKSVHDRVDTSKPDWSYWYRTFEVLNNFYKDSLQERTSIGLDAAREVGNLGGRPKGLSPEAKRTAMLAKLIYEAGDLTVREACNQLGISKRTYYNYLRYMNVKIR